MCQRCERLQTTLLVKHDISPVVSSFDRKSGRTCQKPRGFTTIRQSTGIIAFILLLPHSPGGSGEPTLKARVGDTPNPACRWSHPLMPPSSLPVQTIPAQTVINMSGASLGRIHLHVFGHCFSTSGLGVPTHAASHNQHLQQQCALQGTGVLILTCMNVWWRSKSQAVRGHMTHTGAYLKSVQHRNGALVPLWALQADHSTPAS
jgi:hypothetical protein